MHQRVCKGWIDPRHRTRVLIFSRTNKRCNTFGTHVPWTEIHSSCRRFSPRFTSSLSLSNHSLLITGSKLREPNRGAIFWNEGRSEDGKREGKKGKYSFTDHTRLGWSTALFLSFSFSLCEIGNDGGKKPKKTFLVAGLSARLCLRGSASGSLYKRSWPGGGRVCLPFKRGPRLAALL